MSASRTRAEIDLGGSRHNIRELKKRVGDSRLMAAVKADAYGHEAILVAKAEERERRFSQGAGIIVFPERKGRFVGRAVKFSEIREASPGMRRAVLAGIVAEAKSSANGGAKDLDAEIAKYEERHGLASSQLLEELSRGGREETEEILSWLILIRLRDRIESSHTA